MNQEAPRLLRLPEVEKRCGLKRSALYKSIANGEFPRAIPLSKRAVAWLSTEIDAWIAAKAAARPQ